MVSKVVKTWTVRAINRRSGKEYGRYTVLASTQWIAADAVLRDHPETWACRFEIKETNTKKGR